jgi:hypothetical protein
MREEEGAGEEKGEHARLVYHHIKQTIIMLYDTYVMLW